MNPDKIQEAYQADQFFAVIDLAGLYYAESPEEQGLSNDDQQECLVRLFISRDEANSYCDYLNALIGDMQVISTDLTSVWGVLRDIDEMCMDTSKCTVRVAFCYLDDESWPIELDTIHSIYMLPS